MFFKGSLTIIVCLIIQTVVAQYRDVSQLLSDLQNGYRKDVLPTRTARSYVTVKVYPAIVRINHLDANKEELSSTISLSLYWTDDRLSWDPRDHGGVSEVYMPASSIWLPDISVHNTITAQEPFKDQLVEVSNLGNVLYVKNVHARSYCHMDLEWFPRDQHKCELIFSSWIYSRQKMMIEFMHVNTSTTDIPVLTDTDPNIINLDSHEWELVARKARAEINMVTYACCPDESYLQLKVVVNVKRNVSFFRCLTDIYILPILVATMLVPFQFLLPAQTSRIMFGLFLLFGECVPMVALSSYVPEHSSVPFIGVINILCIFIATLALVGSMAISKLCECTKKQLPVFLQKILRISTTQKNAGSKKSNTFTENNSNTIERDNLLHENNYIEMDTIDTTNEPNGGINRHNGRTNESNGSVNRSNNIEVTTNSQITDCDRLNLTLSRIMYEMKQIHLSISDNFRRKENEDWLNLVAFLDKVLFFVFLVLFIIILIVLIITLLM